MSTWRIIDSELAIDMRRRGARWACGRWGARRKSTVDEHVCALEHCSWVLLIASTTGPDRYIHLKFALHVSSIGVLSSERLFASTSCRWRRPAGREGWSMPSSRRSRPREQLQQPLRARRAVGSAAASACNKAAASCRLLRCRLGQRCGLRRIVHRCIQRRDAMMRVRRSRTSCSGGSCCSPIHCMMRLRYAGRCRCVPRRGCCTRVATSRAPCLVLRRPEASSTR